MERLRLIVGGKSEYASNGTKVSAFIANPLEEGEEPDGPARHEIKHARVAQRTGAGVIDATIVPGPGYLGLTRLRSSSIPALIAPDLDGEDGGGDDMFKARMSGINLAGPAATARSILYEEAGGIRYAASLLQKRKTMSGGEIEDAVGAFNEGEKTIVEFRSISGEVGQVEQGSGSNLINAQALFPGVEVELELAQAA